MAGRTILVGVVEEGRGVTGLAWLDGVEPEQREVRQFMIEPNADIPAGLAVAFAAVGPQCSVVCIAARVAVFAVRSEFFLVRVDLMALLTGDFGVPVSQRKGGFSCVIEVDRVPCALRMARRAIISVSPPMYIVCRVAVGAAGLRLLAIERPGMAETAREPGVAVR